MIKEKADCENGQLFFVGFDVDSWYRIFILREVLSICLISPLLEEGKVGGVCFLFFFLMRWV